MPKVERLEPETDAGGWEAVAFLVEVAGPEAGLAEQGITIANGHGGNSTGR